jgi:hypothetical protein
MTLSKIRNAYDSQEVLRANLIHDIKLLAEEYKNGLVPTEQYLYDEITKIVDQYAPFETKVN